MSSWMPAFNPQLMQAALAQQKGAAPAAMPGRQIGPQPVPPAPVLPPGGQPAPPATLNPPLAAEGTVPKFHQAQPPLAPPSQVSDMPLPTPTPPPAAPGASDDPALNPWAKGVEQARAGFDTERQKVDTLMGQQPKAPNRADYKPQWWKAIVAPLVGALAAQNHGNPEPAVEGVLNGKWNQAVSNYGAQNKAWEEKLGAEEKTGIPLASDQLKAAQEGAALYETNRRNNTLENRENETERHNQANEKIAASWHDDRNEILKAFDEGRIKDANRALDDKEKQYASNDAIRQEIAGIRDRMATVAENKTDAIGANGLTSSEQRRYGSEISELNKKRSDIVSKGFDSNFTKKQLKAIDDRLDEIDKTIQEKRTTAKPAAAATPVAAPAAAAPAAQGFQANPKWPAPATERSMMQDAKGKTVAEAVKGADGKLSWAAPQ